LAVAVKAVGSQEERVAEMAGDTGAGRGAVMLADTVAV